MKELQNVEYKKHRINVAHQLHSYRNLECSKFLIERLDAKKEKHRNLKREKDTKESFQDV
jgi:uncharacterized protein YutD